MKQFVIISIILITLIVYFFINSCGGTSKEELNDDLVKYFKKMYDTNLPVTASIESYDKDNNLANIKLQGTGKPVNSSAIENIKATIKQNILLKRGITNANFKVENVNIASEEAVANDVISDKSIIPFNRKKQ